MAKIATLESPTRTGEPVLLLVAMDKKLNGVFPLMLIRTAGLPLSLLDVSSVSWPEEIGEADRINAAFDALLSHVETSPFRTAVYNARKAFFQKQKAPAEAFCRMLQQNERFPEAISLLRLLNGFKSRLADKDEKYRDALRANYRALQHAARNETLRRALLFASHDLLDRLPGFCERSVDELDKKGRRIALSLLQFLARAVVKTTPLSRFATVSCLRIGEEQTAEEPPFRMKSEVTPNVALLPSIYEVLLREPAFLHSLSVVLNPCITTSGSASWFYFDGEREVFQNLENHPVAGLVVQILISSHRNMQFGALLRLLETEVEASRDQLQAFVSDLVDIGLLEWDFPEKGLAPGWCGGLYQYLAFLPESPPLIVETAALLQWLRTSARTLSFLDVTEVQTSQRQAAQRLHEYFDRFDGVMPPLPPEQIFFEDVNEEVSAGIPGEVIQQLAGDLADCWREMPEHPTGGLLARVILFGRKVLKDGESISFTTFCERFLKEGADQRSQPVTLPRSRGKAGALLQVFKKETGDYGAVVNGLFPGGGKLFARWSHLFPAQVEQELAAWSETMAFPWQGWSNANFQPVLSKNALALPDGRLAARTGGRNFVLGNVKVRRRGDVLQLFDSESNEVVHLTDLGLDAPEMRPAAMQVLYCLAVPFISLQPLIAKHLGWGTGGAGWRYRERVEFRSLVLLRKAWEVDPAFAFWPGKPGESDFFYTARKRLSCMDVPSRFFARFRGEKPSYFDYESPASMYLFGKMLRQTKQNFIITEMLPEPGQCVVRKDGLHAAEFVVEFEI